MQPGAKPQRCIVCGSGRVSAVGDIDGASLAQGYRRLLGVDITRLLSGVQTITEYQCGTCELLFFWPLVTGDQRFYVELAANPWYYMEEKPEFGAAMRYIGPGHSVLEVGGGRGSFAKYVGLNNYVGLEFSEPAIRAARSEGIDMTGEPLDRHGLAAAERYDAACAFQVLEHVTDPRRFVQDLARCVKPGGRLILSVPSEEGFVGKAINDFLNLPPHHVTRWTEAALRALARNCSLRVEALVHEPVAPYHLRWYLLVRAAGLFGRSLVARPGARIRLDFPHFYLWRALALAVAVTSKLSAPWVSRVVTRRSALGHTVLVVLRKESR